MIETTSLEGDYVAAYGGMAEKLHELRRLRTNEQVRGGAPNLKEITPSALKVRTNEQVRGGEIRRAQADRKRKAQRRHRAAS